MKLLYKIALIFLGISIVGSLLISFTNFEFGKIDYFLVHGYAFLIFIALFPRLTLLFSGLVFNSIEFGGIFWWLGFFIAPRILVACLATMAYFKTNPILCIISWLFALGGEATEKTFITNKIRPRQNLSNYQGSTIDAEYIVKN